MRTGTKLNKEEKLLILQDLSQFESVRSIQHKIFIESHKNVSVQTIYGYRQRYQDNIRTMRDEFLRNVSAIPLSNKSYRLKSLQRILDTCLESGKDLHTALKCISIAQREFIRVFENEKTVLPHESIEIMDDCTLPDGTYKDMSTGEIVKVIDLGKKL